MLEIKNISTDEAENNFIDLIEGENRTYFLNGTWGSGKTQFINNVEKKLKQKGRNKFVYLNLWELQNNRSVIKIAFENFFRCKLLAFNFFVIICVTISLLMTNVVNLGIANFFENGGFWWTLVYRVCGIIALLVVVWQFFKIKFDDFYYFYFSNPFLVKLSIRDKILIIDDFDRISQEKQLETYKLFNILKGKLPVIFLGDINYIAMNKDKYLQKIIDRYIDLPYVLHPSNIWDSYFQNLEKEFNAEISYSLKKFIFEERRNLREQIQFNEYINQEFYTRNKLDHVQVDQQIMLIYLYLFHREYYQQLLTGWFPHKKENEENLNIIEREIFDILGNATGYPKDFKSEKALYLIFESIKNLSIKEMEKFLKDDNILSEKLIENGSTKDDFYYFITDKYKTLWQESFTERDMQQRLQEKITIPNDIIRIDKIIIKLLRNNKTSNLVNWVASEIVNRENPSGRYIIDINKARNIMQILEKKYLFSFDVSQKIYFYFFHWEIMFKFIKEIFKKGVEEILDNKEMFSKQNRKAYLLILLVLNEDNTWIHFEDWNNELKNEINMLDDKDFIEFWKLYRIIDIDTPNFYSDELNKINKIVVFSSQFKDDGFNIKEIKYDNLVNFFNGRIVDISKRYNIEIRYSNTRVEREVL